ncbi:class I SAM-dependent methyltransferase [Mycolicibacterium stellerae]|uniref:class I SAM-dependent methyltransferase n=1 Tax=Mycolicibacterium stellerae TaxID=2358193 RepID=UPI0013DDA366|nr:class I SAM-dependent methyltransferase [Mycolicibacterium stellerae]
MSVGEAAPSYAALCDTRKTHPLLAYALRRTGLRTGRALDIGAGAFGDTRYLLDCGFDVDAVDPDPVATELAKGVVSGRSRFTMVADEIQNHRIIPDAYSLVVALHVLPFIPVDAIDRVADDIVSGLRPGGVLCCTHFGVRDSWVISDLPINGVTERRAAQLFTGLQPIYFGVSEHDGFDVEGNPKHWHVLRQVLIKA